MSLDVVVLDKDGRPEREVQIGVDLHSRLVAGALSLDLRTLGRISDYYEDVQFGIQELSALQAEIERLVAHCSGDSSLVEVLRAVHDLASFARERNQGLEAIAD